MTTPDPRYPIGEFASAGRPLTSEERSTHIAMIEAHPAAMRAAVQGLSQEQIDTPYREGGWTVRQVVHHVVDSHANAYVRFKLALTEDSPTICTYEEARWAELPDSRELPVEASLAILEPLHHRWCHLLRGLAPEDFARTLVHPEIGTITVDVLLEIYGWHGPHHVAHVTTLRETRGW